MIVQNYDGLRTQAISREQYDPKAAQSDSPHYIFTKFLDKVEIRSIATSLNTSISESKHAQVITIA